ncbi:MAG: DUF2939 domain-containing protein [Thiomargarita sp.]|nr:DUF2939 domain-containing protein [Thiomargarita sp.]
MKYINGLVFLAVMAFILSPYLYIYKLHNTIAANDRVTFEELIDIESIRITYKENIAWNIKHTVGSQKNALSEVMRQGVQVFGNIAVNTMIESRVILAHLRRQAPIWKNVTYAFFESPTCFIIRLGQLGHHPIHIQMTLQDWSWRITAIYG